MNVIDFNVGSRRAVLNSALWTLADSEPVDIQNDSDRLARLAELVGEISGAYLRGHSDIDAEVMRLAGAALAWADQIGANAAR